MFGWHASLLMFGAAAGSREKEEGKLLTRDPHLVLELSNWHTPPVSI